MNNVQFSVLSYYPSFMTNENINVGILFYDANRDAAQFYSVKKWDRVKAFDDELDIDFMKDYLNGISFDVDNNLFNYRSNFDFKSFVRFYVNEYKFSNIQSVQIDNVDKFIEETKRIYLKFDYEKSERLNKQQEHQYLNKLLKSSNIDFSRKGLMGGYSESIKYDFVIGEYGVKIFTFEGKSLVNLISSAKTWSFSAREMKDRVKTIFIYDKEMKDVEYFESIIKILETDAYKVMVFKEGIDFILSLK